MFLIFCILDALIELLNFITIPNYCSSDRFSHVSTIDQSHSIKIYCTSTFWGQHVSRTLISFEPENFWTLIKDFWDRKHYQELKLLLTENLMDQKFICFCFVSLSGFIDFHRFFSKIFIDFHWFGLTWVELSLDG